MSDPLLSPGQVIGQHRVERLLGRGGIAEVYLVTETVFEVRQALKVMVGDDDDWGRRLIREGRAQFLVQHPNLVRVFGSANVMGRPALVMEYVEGSDLRRWLADLRHNGHWPSLAQALELFRGVLAGVGAVHARGLVHRDLKPANILVEPTHDGVVPKVTDFGLVKDLLGDRTHAEVTVAGTIMGTQGYIAPEQIWALPEIDARADVFALGCILYLLVCRKPAFGDVDTSTTFSKVINEEYLDPRQHVPDLPEPVVLAIRYALVSDRRFRIPSCEALWDVVDRGRVALEELGLLEPGAPVPGPGHLPQLMGESTPQEREATTARRPVREVETVAMSPAMVAHLLDRAETQELPKEPAESRRELHPVHSEPKPLSEHPRSALAAMEQLPSLPMGERPTVAEPAPEPPPIPSEQPRPTVAEPAPSPPAPVESVSEPPPPAPRARPAGRRARAPERSRARLVLVALTTMLVSGGLLGVVGLAIWVRVQGGVATGPTLELVPSVLEPDREPAVPAAREPEAAGKGLGAREPVPPSATARVPQPEPAPAPAVRDVPVATSTRPPAEPAPGMGSGQQEASAPAV
jgi:serine/threonine protein kinase